MRERSRDKDGSTVKVGILHSLSGTMAISEASLKDASLMAIAEINEAGGILGRTIEPFVEDGASDPITFALKARKLIQEDRVATVFGCWTSACRKAVLPVFEQLDALLWYPLQYEGLESSKNIFYTGTCPNQQVEPAVSWLLQNKGKKFYLLGSDCVFTRTVNKIIKAQLKQQGGTLVGETYTPQGALDFNSVIASIKQAKPDVVFSSLNGNSNQAFYQQYKAAGITAQDIPIMAVRVTEEELRNIPNEASAGHYASWSYFQSLKTPKNRAFVQNFQAMYGINRVTSDPIEAAYIQVYLWKQAVEVAQSFDINQVRDAACGQTFEAPEGLVRIEQNQHLWKPCRIGQILPTGQFQIVFDSGDTIKPLPWLGIEELNHSLSPLIIDLLAEVPQSIQYSCQLEREIWERQQTEAALRESEERFRQIASHIREVFWMTDPDKTQMIYVSPAYEQIWGRTCQSLLEKPLSFVEAIHPDDRAAAIAAFQKQRRGEYDEEYRIIRPDSLVRWIRDRAFPIQNETGLVYRVVGIAEDITESKQADIALKKAKEELEIRVEERTRELKRALEQLQNEIIERQLASASLRVSEEKFSKAFRCSPSIITLKTFADGRYIEVNDSFLDTFGYRREEVIGYTSSELNIWVKAEDRRSFRQMLQEVGTVHNQEYDFQTHSGEVRTMLFSAEVIDLGGEPCVICICNDITKRKRAESALQQSEARFRKLAQREELINYLASQIRNSLDLDTVLETAVQAIRRLLQIDRCHFAWFSPHADQPYLQVVKEDRNPDLPDFTGYYPASTIKLVAKKFLNLEMLRVDDVDKESDLECQQFLRSARYTSLLALPMQTSSGAIGLISCSQSCYPRPWSDSEVELLLGVTHQLAIAISQAELYATSRDRSAELEEALRSLQETQSQLVQTEKMSSLGQLVAGVAHEINNPVSFIYGNLTHTSNYIQDLLHLLNLYQQHYPQPVPEIQDTAEAMDLEFLVEDLPKILISMKVGTDRICQIIQSLRNFSRVDQAEVQAVDIHEGIDSTLLILQHRLKANAKHPAIRVIKQYGDLPVVECYAGQLNQVFMNILANGIDALDEYNQKRSPADMEANPSTITIRTEVLEGNERVLIQIRDNGPGIPPKYQSQLFNAFFTTKPIGKGTGLGLSISYQIVVQKHGGVLKCFSEPGQGSEFWIEIPTQQSRKPQPSLVQELR